MSDSDALAYAQATFVRSGPPIRRVEQEIVDANGIAGLADEGISLVRLEQVGWLGYEETEDLPEDASEFLDFNPEFPTAQVWMGMEGRILHRRRVFRVVEGFPITRELSEHLMPEYEVDDDDE